MCYDCGSKFGYLKVMVEFVLCYLEVGVEFEMYLCMCDGV